MADDWQVGDLALCVSPHRNELGNSAVVVGGIYKVEGLISWAALGLILHGHYSQHHTRAHAAVRFIKVTPPAADEFDRETIALLNGQRVIPDIIFTAATPLSGSCDAAGGLTPAGGTPQPHQISGDLAEAERAEAPGGDVFHEVTNAR